MNKSVYCNNCKYDKPFASRTLSHYRYTESGLDFIYLYGEGIRQAVCPECGTQNIIIRKPQALSRAIKEAIIQKSRTLSGDEIRFLRKSIGLSGVEFAKQIGVDSKYLSRLENGKEESHSITLDKLIRYHVASADRNNAYDLHQAIKDDKLLYWKKELRLEIKNKSNDSWEMTEAA